MLEALPAGRHADLPVAPRGLEPADRPRGVGEEPRIGDRLAHLLRLARGAETADELADEAVVEGHAPVRGAEPPARLGALEEGDRPAPVRRALYEAPGPETAAGQEVVRLAVGDRVAGALGFRDRLAGTLVGPDVVAQMAPHVAEPEVPRRGLTGIGEPRRLLATAEQEPERLRELAEEVERVGEAQRERSQLVFTLLVREPLRLTQRLAEHGRRLHVGVRPRGSLRHAHEVPHRLR